MERGNFELSVNDETELLVNLLGLSRLIEFNIRSAFEVYAKSRNIKVDPNRKYGGVLKSLQKHSSGDDFHSCLVEPNISQTAWFIEIVIKLSGKRNRPTTVDHWR